MIQAGIEAGFRETGAVSLVGRQAAEGGGDGDDDDDDKAMPMVAVRSSGLALESLVGVLCPSSSPELDEAGEEVGGVYRIVSDVYLQMLAELANERFVENRKRTERFRAALVAAFTPRKLVEGWEDAGARRERKREEGLRIRERQQAEREEAQAEDEVDKDKIDLGSLLLQEPDDV